MNTDWLNIIQWIFQFILAAGVLYIALRKAPSEKNNLNGGATKSYAEAASIMGEMNRKHVAEIASLEQRLETLERKSYRITIDFTIGEPPTVGIVKIEPFVPDVALIKK